MAVFAGIGLAWALSWAGSLHTGTAKPSWGRLAAASVIGLCLAGLAISAWTARADFRGVYADKEDYLRATRCVQEAAGTTTDKPVFSFGVTFTLAKYTRLRPRDLYYETPATIDAALAPQPGGVRAYLILPLRRFEEQWGWTPMGASYHHLRDAYRLEQRACQGSSFTLFLVR
jgi:hypothetical protein